MEKFIEVNSEDVLIYYLNVDGNIVGSSEVSKVSPDTGFYSRLCVFPEYRNKGYGRALWDKTQKKLDELGMGLIIEINPYGEMGYKDLEKFYFSSENSKVIPGGVIRFAKGKGSTEEIDRIIENIDRRGIS